MEKFTITYQNSDRKGSAEVYAEDEWEAVNEVESNLPETKRKFRILEIIPQGVVSGFDVQLVGSKILWL